jgi:hypothetical protein
MWWWLLEMIGVVSVVEMVLVVMMMVFRQYAPRTGLLQYRPIRCTEVGAFVPEFSDSARL